MNLYRLESEGQLADGEIVCILMHQNPALLFFHHKPEYNSRYLATRVSLINHYNHLP